VTGQDRAPEPSAADVVRAVFAAWADHRVDDVLALVDPRVVWRPLTRPGLSVYEGRDGTVRMMEDLRRAWGEFRLEFSAFTDLGDGQVLAGGMIVREVAGQELVGPAFGSVFTIRAGLVVAMESTEAPGA
jgi:ketosteroid isomerase-like protein